MKRKLGALFVCFLLAPLAHAGKTILPDACGDDKTQFDVKGEKDHPEPAAPAAGKAQIVLIELLDKTWADLVVPSTRYGIDGGWVGANQGDSYFTVDVAPGEHHLCVGWQSGWGHIKKLVGLASLTAEPGKTYYFEAKVTRKVHNYGNTSEVDRDIEFAPVNDDEGRYRIKAGKLSVFSPAR